MKQRTDFNSLPVTAETVTKLTALASALAMQLEQPRRNWRKIREEAWKQVCDVYKTQKRK
jgi:hypothetical protein